MSTTQDNPFKTSDDAVFDQNAQPPEKSKKGCLLGCGIAGAIGLLICCGGVIFFMTKGSSLLSQAINETIGEELEKQLPFEPNVQDKIGEIESLEFEWGSTMQNAQASGEAGGDPRLAFKIKGSKGSGTILVEQDSSAPGGVGFRSGELVMEDGSKFPLDMEAMKAGASQPDDVTATDLDMDSIIEEGDATSDPDSIEIDPGPLSRDEGSQDSDGVDNSDN